MFDNPSVRGLYTSLSEGWTYLNGQDAPQVPERVSAAVSRAFRIAPLLAPSEAASGSHSRVQRAGTRMGESFAAAARTAVADLVGGRPECVILGTSREALVDRLAHQMYRRLRLGQEIVLSRTDDAATVRPWARAGDLYGARLRWAEPDLATGVLPTWQFADIVGPDTSVVAIGAANAHLGTVVDVRAVSDAVRARSSALVVVDVTSLAAFRPLDIEQLGADVVVLDLDEVCGLPVGALVFRSPEAMDATLPIAGVGSDRVLARLSAPGTGNGGRREKRGPEVDYGDALGGTYPVGRSSAGLGGSLGGALGDSWPAGASVTASGPGGESAGTPGAVGAEEAAVIARARAALRTPGLSEGLLGGVSAAVDHFAMLDGDARGTRRRRLRTSLPGAEGYLHGLSQRLIEGLQSLPSVHVIGVDGETDDVDGLGATHGPGPTGGVSVDRIPRVSFLVPGIPVELVEQRLLDNGVVATVVRRGESTLLAQMGVFEQSGGAICVGLCPHNTIFDVDQLLRAVASLT